MIRTEAENERLTAELEDLDRRHAELTPEEREYSELLTVLVEAFEDANYALEGSTPASRLQSLWRSMVSVNGTFSLSSVPAG